MKQTVSLLTLIALLLPVCAPTCRSDASEIRKICSLRTGAAPKSVAISPDGKIAAVNNLEDGSVWFFDTERRKVVKKLVFTRTPGTGFNYLKKIPIPSFEEKPVECIFSADSRYVWISLHNASGIVMYDIREETKPDTSFKTARVYEGTTGKKIRVPFIRTGKTPKCLAFSPDGRTLFASNWDSHCVSVIDVQERKEIRRIRTGKVPRGLAVTKDGKYIFVACMGSCDILKADAATGEVVDSIKAGNNPRHLALSNDGKLLFVSLMNAGVVKKLDAVTGAETGLLKVGAYPRTIVLSPDNKYLFVANYGSNTVGMVDTETMKQTAVAKTGSKPCGLDVSPDGKELWVTNYYANTLFVCRIIENGQDMPGLASLRQNGREKTQ